MFALGGAHSRHNKKGTCNSFALGRGTLKYMKGSKETETWEHVEQMMVFLN